MVCSNWRRKVLDALLPRHCIMCGLPSGPANLCPPCRQDLPRAGAACPACALPLPLGTGDSCGACLSRPPQWDQAIAALLYRFPTDRLICRFKFNRDLACGEVLATELTLAVEEQCKALPSLVAPVPLHRVRQRSRRFNQAEVLARTVSRSARIPLCRNLLRRRRRTRAQSGLDAEGRRKNTRDAFVLVSSGWSVGGRHVALVDDVMTTGATLEACSRVLKKAGAKSVSAWVAARAPNP